MSHAATNWAIQQRGLRPIAKILLWHLADCHNPTMGCFPSQEYLAERCEISRASVNRQLDELESAGMLRREQRVDPTSKRQLATRYFLAFEESFKTQDVVSRVSDCDTENDAPRVSETGGVRVSKSEGSVSQGSETPLTSNGTGNETKKSPQPPSSGGPSFTELWKIWPEAHRGRWDNAEGAFCRLSFGDQAIALSAATLAVRALGRRKGRFPALVRYLRERIFAEFHDGPDIDTDGAFIITPKRPEWGPWLGWLRNKYGQRAVDSTVRTGFFLPERRWPEGYEVRVPA